MNERSERSGAARAGGGRAAVRIGPGPRAPRPAPEGGPVRGRSRRPRAGRVAANLAGLAVALFAIFPVFWMISTSLKPNREIFSVTPQPVPRHPTLRHYQDVLGGEVIPGVSFGTLFANSALVAAATVLLSGLFALLAAVAVARFRFRFRTSFLIMLLVVQMIPLEALVIPLFLMIRRIELYNTLPSLVLVYLGFSLPFAIWMLRGFVAAVPKELEEAAAIDGASRWQTFWRILLPLVVPGLVATSIFSFITAWNEFVFAYTFISTEDRYTLPVAVTYFFGRDDTAWGPVMAMSTLLTLPVMIFFVLVQRRMVSGLVSGAVKG